MRIEHFAMYVLDLERMKDFFMRYFNAVSNELYHNKQTGFITGHLLISSFLCIFAA